jgi:predicted dehydrogenase
MGIMGTGWPGRMHADALAVVPGARVAAVAEPDPERRARFVEAFGDAREFEDYRAMLKEGDLDAAVVALPTSMHYRACMDSLRAGCHVLCEKPPTTAAAEMVKVARAAGQRKLTYMFARQPRYGANVLAASKLVRQGRLGEVYHAESKGIRARGIPFGKGGWFVDRKKGGGVLLDLGVHMIDNPWFVMGCPRPVEAFGGAHVGFSHLAPKGVEYTAEDMAVGMVRFETGATLVFTVTFALNTEGPVSEVKVYGRKGGVDVWGGKLIRGRGKDVEVVPLALPRKPRPPFEAQAREFVRAVRSGGEPLNSASQAVMLMQTLDALRKSAETGKSVRIPPAKI